jgi:hypothetical protein
MVAADPGKLKALREWPLPTSRAQLRAFLGLANYFRRFIPHYSTIAAPLTAITSERQCLIGLHGPLLSSMLFNSSNKL